MAEIIIDGVDVSRCSTLMEDYQIANNIEGRYEHIKNVCELGIRGVEEFWIECRNNPNCYFKQRKRKEQECEKLKTQYNCYACETCNGREDYRNMKRHCENAIKAIHRYKQSLDEIEKYIKNQLDEFGNDVYNMDKSAINSIQYIINKAKEQ